MNNRKGVTLVELMIAMAIMSVGILGMVGAFKFFNVGIQSAKTRSLANNIAQERIEFLKNKSYYRILVTTQPAYDTNFDPEMVYDAAPNPPENVNVGGINFTRRVYIRKVNETSSGTLAGVDWTSPDTGLKEIKVYVVWFERGSWRKLEVRNLRENPNRVNQSATIKGHIIDPAVPAALQGVVVRAQENPAQYGETDAAGDYSFSIEPGTYTLLAMLDGYFPKTLPSFGVNSGITANGKDFSLTRMYKGTITGSAWRRDHLVISQVVGSSVNSSGYDQEWVEVYNPTTWTWTMATGLNAGVVGLAYQLRNQSMQVIDFDYNTMTLAPNHYYLFANTGTISACGLNRNADAVYRPSNSNFPNIIKINTDSGNDAAGVGLGWLATLTGMDSVGWKTAGQSPDMREGAAIDQAIGLERNEAYVRRTNNMMYSFGYGRTYDSNDNNNDFVDVNNMSSSYPPHNSANSETPLSGTPAAGAIIFADDSLSSPVEAAADGSFSLVNVATGAWTVYASSGVVFTSVPFSGASSDGFSVNVGNVVMTTTTVYGYVTGRVTDVNNAVLPNIRMSATGGTPVSTNGGGRYTLPVPAGIVAVTANYQSQSPSYVSLSRADVEVDIGEVVKDVDFALYYGGKISGRITTNGVDPLPGIPVVAVKAGVEQGSGISDNNGNFLISGNSISTGTYEVAPQLEAGEVSSPSSATVILTAGNTVSAGNFTVSGAFGYVTGHVRTGSSAGPVITTGVLVYVSTSSLPSGAYPPNITPGLRSSPGVWYAASSNALGEYSVAVKGGYTYNVYAWYTTWNKGVPYPVRKDYTGVSVLPNATVSREFFW